MKTRLRNSLEIAEKKYCDFMSLNTEDFWTNNGFEVRRNHIKIFSEIIENEFEFEDIKLIETGVSGNVNYGLWGFFLGAVVESYGGEMHSVDLDCKSCENSEKIFSEQLPNLKYKTYCEDSVSFLEKPPIIPNIVHLDSYDFQLFNPLPSALHGWKEFEKIEKLMPKGSIILVDDNWLKGTTLEWFQNGQRYERLIELPILGKGANIFQEVEGGKTNFNFIGNHHVPYKMIKIYIKKQ
jgi:hypothetical protein